MGTINNLAIGLMPAAIVFASVDPELAEVKGMLPNGKRATIRLQFKMGVIVESRDLPKSFIAKTGNLPQWLPFEDLTAEGKKWTLKALFPDDVWSKDEIKHKIRWPKVESVWLISSLFAGHGQHYDKLMKANPNNPEQLIEGNIWRIPTVMLSQELGGSATIPEKSQAEVEIEDLVASLRAMLTYAKDSQGEYAGYKLRKGEALYSSVVMRYTDLVDAKEVNQLAVRIAKRSSIVDVRSIQPGQLIKIPLDCLADPFLPEGSKGLTENREMAEEVRRTVKIEAGPRLSGVRIVLDPGHGGIDPGAMVNGVWESDFVYDITMRVRRLLEANTDAQIFTTLRYPGIDFGIREFIPNITKNAVLQTTPPKPNDGESSANTSVNLRWVMANNFFTATKSIDLRKTIFISFHADSRHPSARGTMVYVPASNLVPSKFSWGGAGTKVAELKYGASVNFTQRQKVVSEAQSRLFSEGLLKELRRIGLPIHENRPLRNVINRSGKSFVPAVIRTNVATTKVLIEVVNLQNEEDALLLKNADYREQFAEAVVKSIRTHFRT
ncbi:MAG: N-acetylmuramoyl-L-alanine amidase [Holophagaceae bacterium]|nr:N-acetylmuramoyl-L-alanine amidase [Holophagaceae bacterium]